MNRYNNYHKHSHYSSIFTPDSNSKVIDYINRCLELGEKNYFTTEHGYGGDIFEGRSLCDENNLNCKFGMEGYIVKDPLEKDNRNYHIIIIPKTNKARKKLNLASSNANEFGYYYRPRLFLNELLENFDSNELYITTACVAGLLKDGDSINDIFYPLYEKFGKNLFLEVQTHNANIQKSINEKAIKFSNELGLRLIGANDSHYIYPNQAKERLELLKGKGITYGDEDAFILDYPDYDTMVNRFKEQGVLSISQINEAMETTLVFDECENIDIDKTVKMPTLYPNLSESEKIELLKKEINKGFSKVMKEDNIPKEKRPLYIEECQKEMQVIIDTEPVHSCDYFLLNKRIVDKAVNEYGGVLTRTGRGSCGSFLINKMLGITQIDRLAVDLPIYSERFLSTARALENRSMADVDFNINKQEPFVKATRDLLGENQCYPMIAYGTMQGSESFRNICRSYNLDYDKYNDVSKSLDNYRNDSKWGEYIKESEKYIGTIISASVHPCSHLVSNFNIREELGVLKIGDFLCVPMTSTEADEWKYLKEDFLIVSVWDIISKTYDLVGKPITPLSQLLNEIKNDNRIWKLFEDGITCTLNQFDTDSSTTYTKVFKPKTMEECAMMVSAIRPSFDNFRHSFIHRNEYSTGSKDLDKVFSQTHNYILFQESIMKFFEWLGVTPAESIGLIKKISKKKIKQKDFDNLENKIREQWKVNTGSYDKFDKVWEDMQASLKYSFNTPHGVATACDALYGAYLKVNHPLEYYTVVLNTYSGDKDKTTRLSNELKYFGVNLDNNVKFRLSGDKYTMDKPTNTIYKGIGSIKNIGKACGDNLYTLKDNHYDTFISLLHDIKTNSLANKTEKNILTLIDFFSEFGDMSKLLHLNKLYEKYGTRKTIKKKELTNDFPFSTDMLIRFSDKETDKQYSGVDMIGLLSYYEQHLEWDIETSLLDHMCNEVALLGYTDKTDDSLEENYAIVSNVDTNKYGTTFLSLYSPKYGVIEQYKVDKKWYNQFPCDIGDLLRVNVEEKKKRKKNEDGNWYESDETELKITTYYIIRKFENDEE